MSRLGHQGLFHDRLDADILAEPMVALARQAVQNRNRTLLTWLGRFAQRDPNASGLILAGAGSFAGAIPGAAAPDISGQGMYADGGNLWLYARANPTRFRDPAGTSAIHLFGGTGLLLGLQGTEAKTKGAAAGNVFFNLAFWQQGGMGLFGAGMLYGDSLMGLWADLGWVSASFETLTPGMISNRMTYQQHVDHGDPGRWKPEGEKKKSGDDDTDIPGDVKYYEVWVDEFSRRLEVHFFRDGGGAIKQHTITIRPYSP